MEKPAVSIVCTNYNKGAWIGEAIESFLAQKTDFDFEIILIDDKSTDDSILIMQSYAERFPDKIRLFKNEKNLGITRTWKKICLEACGKYIARCDGDDFWPDGNKLQKQFDLLEKNVDSKWCNTDFDIVNKNGEITERSAFLNEKIEMVDSFEKMLATRGFTMASTWLVEADLMRAVNGAVPDSAIDDTFNIQLELFLRTKLTHLPESMVAYRVNEGSDSRPDDAEKRKKRNQKLAQTQSDYFISLDDKAKNEVFVETVKNLNKILQINEENNIIISKLNQDLGNIYKSLSWKMSKPMRIIERIFRSKK